MKEKPTYEELEHRIKDLEYKLEKFKNNQRIIEITEKEQTQDELSLEREYMKVLMTNIPDYIYFKDRNRRFVRVSNSFCNLFKCNIEEIIGKADEELFPPKISAVSVADDCFVIEKGMPIINKEEGGQLIGEAKPWVLTTKIPWRDKKGNIRGLFGISKDITEMKAAEQVRKESEIKLKELNATKDKFFSIIAHDLKNPISSVLDISEILSENFDEFDTDEQKNFFRLIHDGIKNTNILLENLLTWSQLQKGNIKFNPEKFNLYILFYETIELLKQSAQNKSIKLTNHIPEDIYVDVDKDILLSIIRNLISNAVKFTPKGGEITIKARFIADENNPEFAEITIKDTGIGISNKIQSKLFDISQNISTRGTENESGTGLGLILCKEFVEKHGGKIWIESEIDKGSKFLFTIPKAL